MINENAKVVQMQMIRNDVENTLAGRTRKSGSIKILCFKV